MTRQEEIRVGIHALFSNCFCRGKLSGKNANDWANKYTDTLLADLKSEGVVIKVERGKDWNARIKVGDEYQEYVAVEELI